MTRDRQPIGYWLKHVDGLIDRTFDETLGSGGLTRRHWQVFNSVATEPSTADALTEALKPFVGSDVSAVQSVIEDLTMRGWIHQRPDGHVEISEEGRSAHAIMMTRVAGTRELLRKGITDDEYAAAVAILQRMAANLEAALAACLDIPGNAVSA